MNPFLVLVIIHWVADFFCQTDEMAINKSKSNGWLSLHVGMYTIILLYGIMIYLLVRVLDAPLFFFSINWESVVLFIGLNGILHWITDFFTSRWTSYLYQKAEKNPEESVYGHSWRHWFFTVIGIDQVIHYTCLFLTYQYLIKP